MSNLRYQISRLAQIIIASSVIFSSSIIAQDFPTKPVRIFGQGPGSTADYLSRLLGQKLTEKWGQPVLIDSRAGAGGTVPADIVAKAPADGYTLLMGHAGPNVSAVVLYPNLPYDPVKDLAGVSMVAIGVTVMMVHPSISAGTVLT